MPSVAIHRLPFGNRCGETMWNDCRLFTMSSTPRLSAPIAHLTLFTTNSTSLLPLSGTHQALRLTCASHRAFSPKGKKKKEKNPFIAAVTFLHFHNERMKKQRFILFSTNVCACLWAMCLSNSKSNSNAQYECLAVGTESTYFVGDFFAMALR